MFGEEELGVEYEPEVTDLGGPVDSRVVKANGSGVVGQRSVILCTILVFTVQSYYRNVLDVT